MNAPIDQTHADSIACTNKIRGDVAAIKGRIGNWEPSPMPKGWAG